MENLENFSIDIKILCNFCFLTLDKKLNGSKEKELPLLKDEYVDQKFPLFVTWTIGKEKDLRGCIGTFSAEKLGKNLGKYALTSALNDSRFDPITKDELQHLHVAVSLLTEFEEAKDHLDWEVGKHGIEIDFEARGRAYGGTFLPEVASEQGWDKITTLKYLVKKAGKYSIYVHNL